MYGYVVTSLLFASCLGQIPHKFTDRDPGPGFSFNGHKNFGIGPFHGDFGRGIAHPASFPRLNEFQGVLFDGPQNLRGFRGFGAGDLPESFSTGEAKELRGKSAHGFASVARPKSLSDGEIKDRKNEIGPAFAHVSQTFGRLNNFEEIPQYDKSLIGESNHFDDKSKIFGPELGQKSLSASDSAGFEKAAINSGLNGGEIHHKRFLPSETVFGNNKAHEGFFQLGDLNNLRGALPFEKRLEQSRQPKEHGLIAAHNESPFGRDIGFNVRPFHDVQQLKGTSAHHQFPSPGRFGGFGEGALKVPKHIDGSNNFGLEFPNRGSNFFGSTVRHNGSPFRGHHISEEVPPHSGSSFDSPIGPKEISNHDNILFPGHRGFGSLSGHNEDLFNRNIGFGGIPPIHSGSQINGHSGFDALKGSGKVQIHGGLPLNENLGINDALRHGGHSIGDHNGLIRRPISGGSPFDSASIHSVNFPLNKFDESSKHGKSFGVHNSPSGFNDFRFGVPNIGNTGLPLNGHQNSKEAHIHNGAILGGVTGHSAPLSKDPSNSFAGRKEGPEKFSENQSQLGDKGFGSNIFGGNGFGGNGFGGNGFGGNGFGGNGFGGNGFGGIGFGGNGFGGNDFTGNGFGANGFAGNGFGVNGFGGNIIGNDGFVGNRVHGRPVSLENVKHHELKSLGASKGIPGFDELREFGGRPLDNHHKLNPLSSPSSLSNVGNKFSGPNEFELEFVHGSSSLREPKEFQRGLDGIGSFHSLESIHNGLPPNRIKNPRIHSFQRGPLLEGPFQNGFPKFNEESLHLSSLSSLGAINGLKNPGGQNDIKGTPGHGKPQRHVVSDLGPEGLGTEIIHIGSFDSIGLGKRSHNLLDGKVSIGGSLFDELKGIGSGKFEKGSLVRAPNGFNSKINIDELKKIDPGMPHKRSQGFSHATGSFRTPFGSTNTFIHPVTNSGTNDFTNSQQNTKSPFIKSAIFGGTQQFSESSPKKEQFKHAADNAKKKVLKDIPSANKAIFQQKEPVKSGPLYISHREYASEEPKGVEIENRRTLSKAIIDVPLPAIIRSTKESSRGRLSHSS